ncbi:MAG: hypothetical protein JKX86_05605 [Verrucomicrobiales bacterium]|mgnify:CR=1 FL=1|jgi:hypothetical protein|nr:hypothetical protein [Verrucomicrobiales bacterium]|tara:strand:- start:12 stop:353 length:342 start_codon:yes stop_codon:yes gene_type:complete
MTTLAVAQIRNTAVDRGQDALVVGLRLTGWTATTLLCTLGVVTLFFFVLGSFSIGGTMLQVDNLASRYIAADAGRQAQFHAILFSTLGIALALIGFFRRSSLRAAFDLSGDPA